MVSLRFSLNPRDSEAGDYRDGGSYEDFVLRQLDLLSPGGEVSWVTKGRS